MEIATSTFNHLTNNTCMQINFDENRRAYICLCPEMLPNHAIIYEEYDISPKLSNTKVLPIYVVQKYIKSQPIIFIGLKTYGTDDIVTVYTL